ncbi:hypothetical protein T06_3366 [Trichinella sp. T6]|nr:hypothetical protein T06_3366 [Trichinella sp. T6]
MIGRHWLRLCTLRRKSIFDGKQEVFLNICLNHRNRQWYHFSTITYNTEYLSPFLDDLLFINQKAHVRATGPWLPINFRTAQHLNVDCLLPSDE